jgi:hypothetical protein
MFRFYRLLMHSVALKRRILIYILVQCPYWSASGTRSVLPSVGLLAQNLCIHEHFALHAIRQDEMTDCSSQGDPDPTHIDPEDGGNMFIRNVGLSLKYRTLQRTRLYSSESPP